MEYEFEEKQWRASKEDSCGVEMENDSGGLQMKNESKGMNNSGMQNNFRLLWAYDRCSGRLASGGEQEDGF